MCTNELVSFALLRRGPKPESGYLFPPSACPHDVPVPSPFPSLYRSASGTANSAVPQSKQTTIRGNTHTTGLSMSLRPGKWMAISPVNVLWLVDPHDLQDITLLSSLVFPRISLRVCDACHYWKERRPESGYLFPPSSYCPHDCEACKLRSAARNRPATCLSVRVFSHNHEKKFPLEFALARAWRCDQVILLVIFAGRVRSRCTAGFRAGRRRRCGGH